MCEVTIYTCDICGDTRTTDELSEIGNRCDQPGCEGWYMTTTEDGKDVPYSVYPLLRGLNKVSIEELENVAEQDETIRALFAGEAGSIEASVDALIKFLKVLISLGDDAIQGIDIQVEDATTDIPVSDIPIYIDRKNPFLN